MSTPLSLRTQLLLLVGGPLLLFILIETVVSYRIGVHTADLVFDRWLLDSALSISQEVHLREDEIHFDADITAIEIFEWDSLDEVLYRVMTADQQLLAGSSQLDPAPSLARLQEGPVFEDPLIAGQKARAVSVLVHADTPMPIIVTVAETLNKRLAMTSNLLLEVLLSKGVLLIAVLLTISVAFSRGLRPLALLGNELHQRSPQDLTPIDVGKVPVELRGLVENTNSLLSRIDGAISSREQFIGNIAHQIRTPLAGMKLQAQLAQREQDHAEVTEALERISHAADQMAHVNTQLMKLARAEAAFGRGLRRTEVDLAVIVRNCCTELARRALEGDIRLLVQVPEQPMKVTGEATLLTEMAGNLIENAILYGHPGGHVWITLEGWPPFVTLIVEDDGPGIAREHWPNIFDRFFRPPPSTGEGCGLGLAIVREIALAHGGTVALEEREGGPGARFVVRFGTSGNA